MTGNIFCFEFCMRQYTQMEKFLYEARPYVYGAIALYALASANSSWLMMVSGILLALCCVIVSAMRYEHRKQLSLVQVNTSEQSHRAANQALRNFLKRNR